MTDLDQALERFHRCGFEYRDGVPNYGPMAVEALEALGHGALVTGLLDVYLPRLSTRAHGEPLADDRRASALGGFSGAGEWLATYERDLLDGDWRAILSISLETLLDGVAGPAVHGMIRTAHATRGLEGEDNEHRRRELAFGLAYWSARYQPNAPQTRLAEGDAGDALAIACLSGAERYLASPDARSAYSIGVIGPSALRILAPYCSTENLARALLGVLESCPGTDGTASATPDTDPEVARCAEDLDEIRYRAACSIQEHAITMAEACLREDSVNSHSTLRYAAADAALRLSPPGYREWR